MWGENIIGHDDLLPSLEALGYDLLFQYVGINNFPMIVSLIFNYYL